MPFCSQNGSDTKQTQWGTRGSEKYTWMTRQGNWKHVDTWETKQHAGEKDEAREVPHNPTRGNESTMKFWAN
eukprot:8778676-Pyramimonas_sp.AAC.1